MGEDSCQAHGSTASHSGSVDGEVFSLSVPTASARGRYVGSLASCPLTDNSKAMGKAQKQEGNGDFRRKVASVIVGLSTRRVKVRVSHSSTPACSTCFDKWVGLTEVARGWGMGTQLILREKKPWRLFVLGKILEWILALKKVFGCGKLQS